MTPLLNFYIARKIISCKNINMRVNPTAPTNHERLWCELCHSCTLSSLPHRGIDKLVRVGGAGMLFSAYMQIFGCSPLKIPRTAILLSRMNLKNGGGGGLQPYKPLASLHYQARPWPVWMEGQWKWNLQLKSALEMKCKCSWPLWASVVDIPWVARRLCIIFAQEPAK